MKKIIICIVLLFTFTTCDILQQIPPDIIPPGIKPPKLPVGGIWDLFNRESPISTTFDDAVYEITALHNFEPKSNEYLPLDIQPKTASGEYMLKSGLYSMNAKSFCLRGYSHGPSKGDGHLYAPLKGEKLDFVQSIIEKYNQKPHIPQEDVQIILWAIIAGADMGNIEKKHKQTLQKLFTSKELLEFEGKEWLKGKTVEQIQKLEKWTLGFPRFRNMLNADKRIKEMVCENRSFQEIEKIAIIAGVAPEKDMIREVSKGRWSQHPEGYYLRFFPDSYSKTRIDIYVPFEGETIDDIKENFGSTDRNSNRVKKTVFFNAANKVAMPAKRSGQRIGISGVPVTPPPRPNPTPRPTPEDLFGTLPDCPCNYDDVSENQVAGNGMWLKCGNAAPQYHYGAAYEIRWIPTVSGRPGQQCTYDIDKKLITGGIAAGSPDKISPKTCKIPYSRMLNCGHYREDVIPWGGDSFDWACDEGDVKALSCSVYLKYWAANQGKGCQTNIISGIDHMPLLVNNLNCKEVTLLLIAVNDDSSNASQEVKDYINGKLDYTPVDLKEQLQQINCSDELCEVLSRAITNIS